MQILREAEKQYFQISDEMEGDISDTSDFREQMLLNNHIEGILEFNINVMNREKTYEFNIAEMESLDAVCRREKLGMKRLSGILDDLLQTIFRGREFMLTEEDYILDPNLIFLDRRGKTHVAYYSNFHKPLSEQIQALSSYLMDKVDYTDDAGVLLVYSLYMRTKDGVFSLEELISFVREKTCSRQDKPRVTKIGGPEFRPVPEKTEALEQISSIPNGNKPARLHGDKYQQADSTKPTGAKTSSFPDPAALWRVGNRVQKIKSIAALVIPLFAGIAVLTSDLVLKNGGKDSVKMAAAVILTAGLILVLQKKIWGGLQEKMEKKSLTPVEEQEEATQLLYDGNTERQPDCCLVSDEYPTINIGRFPFYIGKDASHCDFCLDFPGVSRHHVKIDRVGTEYNITDLNSTNGTFLNGTRLAPNSPYRFGKMDKITIGRCNYYMN